MQEIARGVKSELLRIVGEEKVGYPLIMYINTHTNATQCSNPYQHTFTMEYVTACTHRTYLDIDRGEFLLHDLLENNQQLLLSLIHCHALECVGGRANPTANPTM